MSRKNVKIFVSYARANKELASQFLKRFKQQVGASKYFEYEFWRDDDILVGEPWHEEIQKALRDCKCGLFLLSPAFLGSQYISKHELPGFLRKQRKVLIPVELQPVDSQYHDLKGLEGTQIFRLERGVRSAKAFGELTGAKRDAFALELFKKIEEKLKPLFARSTQADGEQESTAKKRR